MAEILTCDRKAICSVRNILWIMVFTGFAVNYMIRINLNIAIVSMVKFRINNTSKSDESECAGLYPNITNITSTVSFKAVDNPDISEINKYDWNEKIQGSVLGSFFWLHWLTQIPGGILAGRYGTKMVFGLSNFFGVIFCLGIPYFSYLGYEYLMIVRLVQGLLSGFAWPSMHHLVGKWIPPNERSQFITAYLGSSVGAALTYMLCGTIIAQWSWQYVFYICSLIGTVWFVAWQFLVFDTPNDHPRISFKEKQYITQKLEDSVSYNKQIPIPWRRILTSRDVWMNIVAQIGGNWGFFTLMTHAPTYFRFIHGWDIMATGFLSGLPHIVRMVWAYFFSIFSDYLLESEKMSRTNVRKLANCFACGMQGVFMICLAYSGCNSLAAIICLTAAVAVYGSNSSGALSAAVDISPNFASIILGLTNTGVAIVGFLTPTVVGFLTFENQTSLQWQKVFWISTLILFMAAASFAIFSRADVRSWNSPENRQNNIHETELHIMLSEKGNEMKKDFIKV